MYSYGLINSLALPAAILDRSGKVVSCNSKFHEAVSDVGENAVLGQTLFDLFPTVDELSPLSFFEKDADRKRGIQVELFTGHFRLSIDPIDDDFLCQLTPDCEMDSTGLRFLLEHLDQGVWSYDLLNDLFTVSDAWRRIRNVPPEFDMYSEAAQDPQLWLDNIHSDDRDQVWSDFSSLVTGDAHSVNVQYRYQVSKGRWRWVLCNAKVMAWDKDGAPAKIVGMDTDITSIKHGELNQLQLYSKLQLALDVSGIGVWEFDTETSQVYWDDTVLGIYGRKGELNNQPENLWETLIHPDDREATVSESYRAFTEKRDFRRDFRIVRANGEIRHVRCASRFVAVPGTKGKMLGVNIDVTDDYARAEELERARQLLEHDSRHDALTGLANRRLLDEHTADLLKRLNANDKFAVLHIDLDHFKQVNDTLGHAAGDQVLIRVADTLRALVGNDGLVCRNGGDEFVIVLETFTGEKSLRDLCENIIAQMAEPMITQGVARSIGLSIGCIVSSGDVVDTGEIFINADVALYAAKSAGRSCYKIFAPELRSVSRLDVTTYHDLVAAMDAGHVICHFQPQFDAQTLEIVGAEALMRWNCPSRGLVLPDDFLPAAQARGLCSRLDACVLDYVLSEQTRWAEAGRHVPTVALNISMHRLMEPDLIEQINAKLKPYHSISFELLETSFLDQRTDELDQVLHEIRQAGIRIDLDDFGSGHSSIVALQSVRPDRVKLDRMLIAPIQKNPAQIHILDALVRVARLENCGVVAEGIETQEQLDAIQGLNCEVVQGFYLGRPVLSDDFAVNLPRAIAAKNKTA